MDLRNWFFKQRVAALEVQDGFQQAEVADENLLIDLFTGGFLLATVSVAETGPQSTSVDVGALAGYDTLGQRVTEAAQAFAFAGDDDPALVTPARLYAKFQRDESDPRTDGLGNNLNFKLDEGALLVRDLGTPGGALPALRVDGSILLANINIPAAAGVITDSDIDTSVQNLRSGFPTSRLADPLSGIARGYVSGVKIVTTGAAVPTDTIDVESATAVNGGASPDILMSVRNAALDLSAGAGPGALDVGVVGNATYYIYLIGSSLDAAPDDVVASLDAGPGYGGVGPSFTNLPSHDRFRLIGCLVRDAGSIVPFRQINGRTYFDDYTLGIIFPSGADPHGGAGPTAFIPLSLAPYCPPIAERATLAMLMDNVGAVITVRFHFRSGGGPTLPGYTNHFIGAGTSAAQEQDSESHMELHVSATQTVDWRRFSGIAITTEIAVVGFTSEFHHEV